MESLLWVWCLPFSWDTMYNVLGI